ncbi:hypothetical protein FOCG_14495 [Fusarium oxysporum f. sp. radicis-lycopersici 26381]|nr:hypothetical protein FOWG_04601 [Fusarium oxysporum f. sp. lycopersici MN25]EXL42933.1 hypothetical protein FOCG_14495 [Fusarium oxysporum f. sp. radicis-lycopersici 26381]
MLILIPVYDSGHFIMAVSDMGSFLVDCRDAFLVRGGLMRIEQSVGGGRVQSFSQLA